MHYARQMHRNYRRAIARAGMVRYSDSDLSIDDLLVRLRRMGPSLGREYARALAEMLDRDPGLRKRLAGRDLAMLEAWRERRDYSEFKEAEHPRDEEGKFTEKGGGARTAEQIGASNRKRLAELTRKRKTAGLTQDEQAEHDRLTMRTDADDSRESLEEVTDKVLDAPKKATLQELNRAIYGLSGRAERMRHAGKHEWAKAVEEEVGHLVRLRNEKTADKPKDKPTADFFQPRGQQGSLFEPGRNVETGGFVGDVQPVKKAAPVYVPNKVNPSPKLTQGLDPDTYSKKVDTAFLMGSGRVPVDKEFEAYKVVGAEGAADFVRKMKDATAEQINAVWEIVIGTESGKAINNSPSPSPEPKPKPKRRPKDEQPRLFALTMHDDWRVAYAEQTGKGRWITIGAKTGEDGKKHGGAPVFVENGKITKGHPRLTGKKLEPKSEGRRRAEPVTSEPEGGWPAFNRRVKLPAPKHGESWDGVVHHGTPHSLEGDTLNPGKERNTTDAGNLGMGVYLSPHHDIAKFYGQNRRVVSVKLSLDKPIVIEGDKNAGAREFAKRLGVKSEPSYDGSKQTNDQWSREFAEKAQAAGYDGVIWSKDGHVEEVVSFDPVPFKASPAGAKLADEDRSDPDAKLRKGMTAREETVAKNKAIAGRNRSEHKQSKDYARAVWTKKARAEGIDAKSLHDTAAMILDNDREFKRDVTGLLQEVRKAHPHLMGVRQKAAKGIDADSVKLLDDIADAFSKRSEYAHLFGNSDPQERLFDLLVAGNPEMMSEEDAYGQAFDLIMEHKHAGGSLDVPDEDPVPFAVEMYQSWEVATFYAEFDESKHPRADDGKFGSGAGKTKKGTPERKAKIAANKTTSQGGGLYGVGFEWSNKFRAILTNLHQNPGHEKTEGWTNEVRDKLAEAYKRAVNHRLHTIREQVKNRFGVAATDSPHFKEFMRATAPNRTPFEDSFKAIVHEMAAAALAHSKGLKDYRHGMDERGTLRRLLNEYASKLSRASAQHADILDAAHKKLWAALAADSQPASAGK